MFRWLPATVIAAAACASPDEMEEPRRTGIRPPPWILLSPVEPTLGPVFHENRGNSSPLDEPFSFGIDLLRLFGVTKSPTVAGPESPEARPEDLCLAEIRHLTREISYRPRNPGLYERRARLWEELGLPDWARDDLIRAQELKAQERMPPTLLPLQGIDPDAP